MKFRVFLFSLMIILASVKVDAAAVHLNPRDSDFLVRAVASSYPDASFAARTAITSVITNRIASPDYPDTAAGCIASLGDLFDLSAIAECDTDALRMTSDALVLSLSGADPTGGCTGFIPHKRSSGRSSIASRLPLDLYFDDSGESSIRREILTDLSECRIIIDGIGFY